MARITVRDVTVNLAGRTVLQDVSVELAQSRVGVIGANGSGKSTFARLLNGLVLPSSGTVTLDTGDATLDTRRQGAAVRRQVGFVFTDPDAQIVMPTVAEDVAFSLRRHRLPRSERDARVAATLARFGLADHADHAAHLLSGGQKQLLALAAVLVTEPTIVVLDEPTTLLDLRNTAMIRRVLAGLEQQLILVSHDLESMSGMDRVLVIDDGRIVADDEPGPAIATYRALVER